MNRVLFVVTSVDLDQLQQVKALVEQRDDLRSLPIRRPSIYHPTIPTIRSRVPIGRITSRVFRYWIAKWALFFNDLRTKT